MLKSYLKQDNIAPHSHNIILFELDFTLKFPLLRLLQFLNDLKSTSLGLHKYVLFYLMKKYYFYLNQNNLHR